MARLALVLMSFSALASALPDFPTNPRGKVNTTCFAKSGDVSWAHFMFEARGITGTSLNVIGKGSVDGVWGRAGGRYLPLLEGTEQGLIQGWGETGGMRLSISIPVKKDANVSGPLEGKLTLETYRGAKQAPVVCCLGLQGPNPEAATAECMTIKKAALAAIKLATADASLSDEEKTERVKRLQSLESIY